MTIVLDRAAAERLLRHQISSARHSNRVHLPYDLKYQDRLKIVKKFKKYWSHDLSLKELSEFIGVEDLSQHVVYGRFLLPKDRS